VKWRPNVYVAAFVLGAIVLTVLPLLQRRMLAAPEPIMSLPPWTSAAVTSETLRGHVWLVSFVASPCDAECLARQQAFGRALPHLDDLDGGVVLVSIGSSSPSVKNGYAVDRAPGLVDAFRAGWARWAGTDAGSTAEEFARLPGFAVVDQNGALRGFWKDGPEGRGNAINAARLLCERGAQP
jgi:hypothetical protein